MIKENAGIRKEWADGVYTFRLPIGELRSLQASRGPIYRVYGRLVTLDTDLEDIEQTMRLSLIGGGVSPTNAERLINDYIVRPGRWNDARDIAQESLNAALEGVPEETLPKFETPEGQSDLPSSDQMDMSPSENSTPA
jgi:hypothetical protein